MCIVQVKKRYKTNNEFNPILAEHRTAFNVTNIKNINIQKKNTKKISSKNKRII